MRVEVSGAGAAIITPHRTPCCMALPLLWWLVPAAGLSHTFSVQSSCKQCSSVVATSAAPLCSVAQQQCGATYCRPHLMLNVTFSSSLLPLRSTTISVSVCVLMKLPNSCRLRVVAGARGSGAATAVRGRAEAAAHQGEASF